MKNEEQISLRKYLKVKTKNEMINDFNNTWNYPYWVEALQNYLTDRLKKEYLAMSDIKKMMLSYLIKDVIQDHIRLI